MIRRGRAPLLALATAILWAACSGGPGTTDFVPRADLIRISGLDVQLVDATGLSEALLPVPESLSGPFQNGIEPVPGQPRDVIVPWLGGDCDVHATVTLRREGTAVVISIRSTSRIPPGATVCTAGGRLRAVVVRFVDVPPPILLDLG